MSKGLLSLVIVGLWFGAGLSQMSCGCSRKSLEATFVLDSRSVNGMKSGDVLRLDIVDDPATPARFTKSYRAVQSGHTIRLPKGHNDEYEFIWLRAIEDDTGRKIGGPSAGHPSAGQFEWSGWGGNDKGMYMKFRKR